jgi:membrane fusion protein, multidrug efflux system
VVVSGNQRAIPGQKIDPQATTLTAPPAAPPPPTATPAAPAAATAPASKP